jgi:carboxypeptidase PM20D1
MQYLKQIGKGLAALLLFLVAIMLINTFRTPKTPFSGVTPLPEPPDLQAAALRLSQAIRIPTVSYDTARPDSNSHIPELHTLLENSFPLVHATLKKEVVAGSSLLYTWQGSDPSLDPVLLVAHMDVVPIEPGTEGKWSHPPFSGVIADGYIWGRGALDMKHVVMAIMEGAENLIKSGYRPTRTILIAFGHDEEIGGYNGAKNIVALLKERKVRALFSIDEGSAVLNGFFPGVQRPIAQIGLSEKGSMSLLLTANTQGGHSSMPPPHTAIGKIGHAIVQLEQHQMPASLNGPGGIGIQALGPELPFGLRVAVSNSWLFEPVITGQLAKSPAVNALLRTTTAPTIVEGGVKENVLPSQAKAVINFRLAPGDTVAMVKNHVTTTINDPDITVSDYHDPGVEATSVADRNGPGFQLISHTINQIFPDALVIPGLVVAGTDSKHYGQISQAAYRFTPMVLTPADVNRIHGIDERISVDNYGKLIAFYGELMRNSAR